LRVKVSNLEAERENLLAVIQLLTEEKQTVSNSQTRSVNIKANDSNIESNSDGVENQDGPWLKVGKNGKEKRQNPPAVNDNGKQNQRDKKNSNEHGSSKKCQKQQINHEEMSGQSATGNQSESRVTIIGDSMTKHINGRKLSKSHKVTSKSFSGATIEDLEHHVKSSLKYKPDYFIIHAGTNNLRKDSPKEMKKKLDKLVSGFKTELPNVDIAISSVMRRSDNPALNSKILEVNNILKTYCEQNHFDFINNDNIREQFLNTGGLHLNPRGIQTLASNFRNYLTY
jgi:hypothetical protein